MADLNDIEPPVPRRGGGGGGGRRGGGRGGGGGGRGHGDSGGNRDVILSKALSTLLRHQAEAAGVELDGEGFARLDQVFAWPRIKSLKPSVSEIKASVADNAKQRFTLKRAADQQDGVDEDEPRTWLIRANQGHSIKLASEGLHTPITLGAKEGEEGEAGNVPAVVVHGTYFIFWSAILAAGGLKKMGRTHVHFGTGLPEDGKGEQSHDVADEEESVESGAAAASAGRGPRGGGAKKVISGMRSDAELLIFVDVEQSLRDGGIEWWLSSNGVVLTEGDKDGVVPLKYFKEVRGRKQGVGLVWKDGEKVADLPETTVLRMPHGKGPKNGGGGGGGRGGGRGGGGRGGKQ